jgi:large subunit ribosomal protein L10
MKPLEKGQKKQVVDDLGARLQRMNSMFIAEYSGMSVAQVTRLRRELRTIGVDFTVVKNTLLKIASVGTKAAVLQDQFHGPNAIVCIYNDPVGAAKIVQNFAREVPLLKVKAGFLGDQALTLDDIVKLSTLPPKDVLIAKFMGLLQSMPQRFVYVLSGNLSKLLYTLDAIKTQKAQA